MICIANSEPTEIDVNLYGLQNCNQTTMAQVYKKRRETNNAQTEIVAKLIHVTKTAVKLLLTTLTRIVVELKITRQLYLSESSLRPHPTPVT